MDEGAGAPTQVGGELTELAGVAEADTMSAFAWSEDDSAPEVEPESSRPFWVTTAAVAASLSLVTVAGILGYRYMGGDEPAPAALSAPVTTTVPPPPIAAPPVPPPPPVTVTTVVVQSTIQAPAAQPPQRRELPDEAVAALDRQFIAKVQAIGGLVLNPSELTHDAHLTCAYLQQGKTVAEVNQMYAGASGRGLADAQVFTSLVMTTYPDCP